MAALGRASFQEDRCALRGRWLPPARPCRAFRLCAAECELGVTFPAELRALYLADDGVLTNLASGWSSGP